MSPVLKVDSYPAKHYCGAVVAPTGRKDATFLMDNGADVNLVSRAFALQHNLQYVYQARLPNIGSFQGKRAFCYGAHRLRIRLADSFGGMKESVGLFYAVDLDGPPVVLGRPWRHQQAVLMDSATDHWRYGSESTVFRLRDPVAF